MKRFFFSLLATILTACTSVEMLPATPTSIVVVPTMTSSVTECSWELIPPVLTQVEPNPVIPRDPFKLIGLGGFLRDSCGGVNESARSFDVYLDNQTIGKIVCYVNHCQGDLIMPVDIQAGEHCLSIEPSACNLEIQVADS